MSIRDLPPWQQRDERIRSHEASRKAALEYIRSYSDKHGEVKQFEQPDFNTAQKYDAMIDRLLEAEWKELGDEPKTADAKRALADRLERWAVALRAEADKEAVG